MTSAAGGSFSGFGLPRAAGVLLHPTSLPASQDPGLLGQRARDFVDWLAATGQSVWQVLPVGPPGRGRSPYDARSSFAGDPTWISAQDLAGELGLRFESLGSSNPLAAGLRDAWSRVRSDRACTLRSSVDAFLDQPSTADWLNDWALFAALTDRLGTPSWPDWPPELASRERTALRNAHRELAEAVDLHRFAQALFDLQWTRLRSYAAERGVRLFGDLPIYVAHDSAEAWSGAAPLRLDPQGRAEAVGGVPPDDFSDTGQRWGHPVYDWPRSVATDHRWWIERIAAQLRRFDLLRLDHFRGFVAYWEIPVDAPDATAGHWRPGPGEELFSSLAHRLGPLPLVAEDLGLVTEDVVRLRDRLGLPGVRVLQFAFDDPGSPHLPGRIPESTVIYTGTHDNLPTRGWYRGLSRRQRRVVRSEVGGTGRSPHRELAGAAFASRSHLAILPMQDVLGLGAGAAMNRPGTSEGNWQWRLEEDPPRAASRWLRKLTEQTGRRAELRDPPD